MRLWPFRRRNTTSPDVVLDDAHKEMNRAIRDAEQLRCRAEDVTDSLKETWRRNHIAEAVIRTIRGHM